MRTSPTLPVAAAFLTAALALSSASPAQAASALRHKNVRSGYCLGMTSGHTTVSLISCRSNRTAWKAYAGTRVGGRTYYKLKNPASGVCLGVWHSSGAGGAGLAWGHCTSTRDHSQLWRLKYIGRSSTYQIVNGHSGLCAGTRGSSTARNTPVVQGHCTTVTGSTQLWKKLSG
ncbi:MULTISPECIES: RICIN domain-containing protein [unclassified Streptomyces]|uniref:RICIN domain-containing protein n=1 Tax=unclassified Streptomyces TaxID=2593676 RepID=UPI00367F3F68